MMAKDSSDTSNFSSQVYQEIQSKWDEVHNQLIGLSTFKDDSEEFNRELRKFDELLANINDHKKVESDAGLTVLFKLVEAECEVSEIVEKLCRLIKSYLIEIFLKQNLNESVEKGERLNRVELEETIKIIVPTVDYIRGIFVHRLYSLLLILMEEGLGFASGNPMTLAAIKNKTAQYWQWASYPNLNFRSGEGRSIKWNPLNLTFEIMEAMASISNPRAITYSSIAKKMSKKSGANLTAVSLAQSVRRNHIDWKGLKKFDKTRRENVK